jgi:hypothetical protein
MRAPGWLRKRCQFVSITSNYRLNFDKKQLRVKRLFPLPIRFAQITGTTLLSCHYFPESSGKETIIELTSGAAEPPVRFRSTCFSAA